MIRIIFSLLAFFAFLPLQAQLLKPASWSFSFSKEQVKVNEEVDLVFSVRIDGEWYLYSTDFDPDLGPTVTTFQFEPHSSYELIGEIKPIGSKKKYDEIWEGDVTYFENKGLFKQTVKLKANNPFIKGTVSYQVCTDVDGKCIPFDDDFSFKGIKVLAAATETLPVEESSKNTGIGQNQNLASENIAGPSEDIIDLEDDVETSSATYSEPSEAAESAFSSPLPEEEKGTFALLSFMLIAFLAGLAALLTPCVYPMIPMTVSFFSSNSKNRKKAILKAAIYGLSIIAIYTLAGTIITIFFGPETPNFLSTHWIPNIIFFAVFIIFGLSFLGLFEITLPSSIINRVDKEADKGGYYGTVFMALTLVLVSFSCTGPIVGSLLVESSRGAIVKPMAGMFAFSLAFAIPFTLFAIFPEWLGRLPKSGGWLNSVKVVLGFLELALALKFLSIVDQVYHWNLLDREIFLAIWIAIFSLMGFYLLGKIKLPHDSEIKSVSVPRLMLALITFSFIIYLIPGLFGAPLKSMAGLLPPMTTQDFNMQASHYNSSSSNYSLCSEPINPNNLKFPHGIQGYFDYEQALACAKEQNKPLFIDFTGHGCVNCRLMEAKVWSDPEVLKSLKDDFVMLALYVDEKKELPEHQWYKSTADGKVKKTIGSKNADFQITRFGNNAQPFYVILGHNEQELVKPIAYESDARIFKNYLDAGLKKFHSTKAAIKPAQNISGL